MSSVAFEYDPNRGGFCLQIGTRFGESSPLFGGVISVYQDQQGRIATIESSWDHGGLPLRGIHRSEHRPQGKFSIESDELRIEQFQLNQSAERLELWFGGGSQLRRVQWSKKQDAGVTVWLSREMVQAGWPVPGFGGPECRLLAGLAVELCNTGVDYPISSLRLLAEDFK